MQLQPRLLTENAVEQVGFKLNSNSGTAGSQIDGKSLRGTDMLAFRYVVHQAPNLADARDFRSGLLNDLKDRGAKPVLLFECGEPVRHFDFDFLDREFEQDLRQNIADFLFVQLKAVHRLYGNLVALLHVFRQRLRLRRGGIRAVEKNDKGLLDFFEL